MMRQTSDLAAEELQAALELHHLGPGGLVATVGPGDGAGGGGGGQQGQS